MPTALAAGDAVTVSMTQAVLALLISLGACTAGGYTMRLNRPSFGGPEATRTVAPAHTPSDTPARTPSDTPVNTTEPANLATPSEPITSEGAGPTAPTPTDGTAASDGGTAYVDPDGHFELWFGDSWFPVDVADGTDFVTSDEVEWRLRLQRGEPGAPIPSGAAVPPNGAEVAIGLARIEPGADLADWALEHLPVDSDSFSITADAMQGTVGAEAYDGVFREGQILPYYGRWREWLVPDPRAPGRAYVVRLMAYGREDNWEMAQSKVVARTLWLR